MKNQVNFFSILFAFISFIIVGGCTNELHENPAVVTTYEYVTSITSNSANIMGTDDSGGSVTEVGICWNTTGNPTTNDFKVISRYLTGGIFFGDLTNLKSHTKYVARAYGVHGKHTYYGSAVSFITGYDITTSISEARIASTSATIMGKAIDIGIVKEVGVSWSTYAGGEDVGSGLSSKLICNVNADGSFIANLTDLAPNMHYYLVPYLINNEGTFYGKRIDFITKN